MEKGCAESRFSRRFLTPLNLQGIIGMAFEEKKELNFLLTGGGDGCCEAPREKLKDILTGYNSLEKMVKSVIPKYDIVKKRQEMRQMLEYAKPYFYEIAGIEPVKDPELFVRRDNFTTTLSVISPYLPYIALSGVFAGGAAFLLGLGAIASAGIGAAFFAALSGRAYRRVSKAVKRGASFALPAKISDRIYIAPGQRAIVFNNILHEYTHNVCFKIQIHEKDRFFEDGLATAMAQKSMISMGKEQPAYEAFVRLQKISYAIDTFTHITQLHSNDRNIKNIPLMKGELVPYVCGSTMVHLAEFKYGKEIYKDLFRGKYGCLLD